MRLESLSRFNTQATAMTDGPALFQPASAKSKALLHQPTADQIQFSGALKLRKPEDEGPGESDAERQFNDTFSTLFLFMRPPRQAVPQTQAERDEGKPRRYRLPDWTDVPDDVRDQVYTLLEKHPEVSITPGEIFAEMRTARLQHYQGPRLKQKDADRHQEYLREFQKGDYHRLGEAIGFVHFHRMLFGREDTPGGADRAMDQFGPHLNNLVDHLIRTNPLVVSQAVDQMDRYAALFRAKYPTQGHALEGFMQKRHGMWEHLNRAIDEAAGIAEKSQGGHGDRRLKGFALGLTKSTGEPDDTAGAEEPPKPADALNAWKYLFDLADKLGIRVDDKTKDPFPKVFNPEWN